MYGGRRLYQYNKDDFLIYIKLLNSMDTHKHVNKEKLSIKKRFSLITCKLVI